MARFSLNCMTIYPYNKTYPIDGWKTRGGERTRIGTRGVDLDCPREMLFTNCLPIYDADECVQVVSRSTTCSSALIGTRASRRRRGGIDACGAYVVVVVGVFLSFFTHRIADAIRFGSVRFERVDSESESIWKLPGVERASAAPWVERRRKI